MRRFFIEPSAMAGHTAILSGPDARHITTVLRLKPGERIVLFDGTGRECHARILASAQDRVSVSILDSRFNQAEPPIRITIAQGLLKDKKMDALVRPLTELGMCRWVPFFAARSVPRASADRMSTRIERWRKITLEALKQCGRGVAPEVLPPVSFEEVLSLGTPSDVKIAFWEKAVDPLPVRDVEQGGGQSIFVLLGPEGGFTDKEMAKARTAGFSVATLGPRILRAETAALAACSLVQYLFGDLGGRSLVSVSGPTRIDDQWDAI
jgi:16S rRNA (uracil1498-N3)-methyltransferase